MTTLRVPARPGPGTFWVGFFLVVVGASFCLLLVAIVYFFSQPVGGPVRYELVRIDRGTTNVGNMMAFLQYAMQILFALLMAAFFVISGTFRIVASLHMRFANWGWSLLSGFVSLLLGMLIWTNWPCSTIMIGVFIGLELIFNGWAWVMFSLMVRTFCKAAVEASAPAGEGS